MEMSLMFIYTTFVAKLVRGEDGWVRTLICLSFGFPMVPCSFRSGSVLVLVSACFSQDRASLWRYVLAVYDTTIETVFRRASSISSVEALRGLLSVAFSECVGERS